MSPRSILLPILLLAASSLTAARAQTAPLTGLDAWKAIVGNTLAGKTPSGEPLVQFFAPDGALRNRIAGKPGEGEWSLRDARLCIDYSEDGDDDEEGDAKDEESGEDEEAECFGLSVQGDMATLTDENGKAQQFSILRGNAERL